MLIQMINGTWEQYLFGWSVGREGFVTLRLRDVFPLRRGVYRLLYMLLSPLVISCLGSKSQIVCRTISPTDSDCEMDRTSKTVERQQRWWESQQMEETTHEREIHLRWAVVPIKRHMVVYWKQSRIATSGEGVGSTGPEKNKA